MEVLRVYSLEDYQSLIPGLWGIREPPREYDGSPRQNGKRIVFLIFPILFNTSCSSGRRERGNRPRAYARFVFDRSGHLSVTHL